MIDFHQKIKKRNEWIEGIQHDLRRAIANLNLNLTEEQTLYEPHSFLDLAILLALYHLELHIIYRVITCKRAYPARIETFIKND